MRRLLKLAPTLGLLGLLAGCELTHGVCDCDPRGYSSCCPSYNPTAAANLAAPVITTAAPAHASPNAQTWMAPAEK